MTYDEQHQACIFIDTNARLPAEGSMYVIFHEPMKRYFRYNPTINKFKVTEAKDCDRATRYLLYKCYVRQCTAECIIVPYFSLYVNCLGHLGVLHYNSLYALSLHKPLLILQVPCSSYVRQNKRIYYILKL